VLRQPLHHTPLVGRLDADQIVSPTLGNEQSEAHAGNGTVGVVTTPGPSMRIGDDERNAAAASLGEHYAHGRLEAHEYEERVTAAYIARTAAELEPLFSDLPRPPAPAPPVRYLPMAAVPMADVQAPYGRHPVTGRPYSDRSKVVAGLLQLFLPFGVGRFYTGHYGVAVAQLVTSLVGIGVFWSWIDGIVLLAGRPNDPFGRPLRT